MDGDGSEVAYNEGVVNDAKELLRLLVGTNPHCPETVFEIFDEKLWVGSGEPYCYRYVDSLDYLESVVGAILVISDSEIKEMGKMEVGVDWKVAKEWYKKWFADGMICCLCGEIWLNTNTGDGRYLGGRFSVTPETKRYRMLRLLLEAGGKLVSHEEIAKRVTGENINDKNYKRAANDLINDLKGVLQVDKSRQLFKGNGGFRIVCKLQTDRDS